MTADRLIAGRYRLTDPIGSGAMGVVWRATDVRLRRTVAVKQVVVAPGLAKEVALEAKVRAMREGRIAARLHHPHAIAVFDVADEDGQPWLVMEYMDAPSLATRLSGRQTLSATEAARIGAQAASALAAAHDVGIVHRDVKPANLLVSDDGTVKITDFGISRAVGDVTVTASGFMAGTPAYLAPEVARGEASASASDVFALGSTLYAAVTGAPPFGEGENPFAVLHAVAHGEVREPENAGPLGQVLMRMLSGSPEERPSMHEARQMLEDAAAGRAVTTPPATAVPAPSSAAGPALPGATATPVPPESNAPAPHAETKALSAPGAAAVPSTAGSSAAGPPSALAKTAGFGAGGGPTGDQGREPAGSGRPPPPVPDPTTPDPRVPRANSPGSPFGPRVRGYAAVRWGRPVVALAVVAVAAVAVAVGLLAVNSGDKPGVSASGPASTGSSGARDDAVPGDEPEPKPSRSQTTAASSTAPPPTHTMVERGPLTADKVEHVVRQYYGLLPGDISAAWSHLSPSYQAVTGGYDQYAQFWSDIGAITVNQVTPQGADVAVANLTYTLTDGSHTSENRWVRVGDNGRRLVIDDSGV